MLRRISTCAGLLLALVWLVQAQASHHGWVISEVFSNADGTIQFIELSSAVPGHGLVSGFVLFSDDDVTGLSKEFPFPNDISSETENKFLLLATSGFQDVFGIAPDFVIPAGFLATGAGTVQFNGFVMWSSLPTDGYNSLSANGSVAPATPKNFAGAEGLITDTTPPVLAGLPTSVLVVVSNDAVAGSSQEISDYLAPISCSDDRDPSPSLTIELPAEFAAGQTTTVPISCTDDDGNTQSAQAQITVETFLDTDSDGIGDDSDEDDDNDGVGDALDAFPLDDTESTDTDNDGTGNNADADDDGDDVSDSEDVFPLDSTESLDTDSDGIGNNADTDDDGDSVLDANDVFPLDPGESADKDNDGIGDNADSDDDLPPDITLTTPMIVDATGRLTLVDFSDVSATDVEDGPVDVSADSTGPFASGLHVITWLAIDSQGNSTSVEQVLQVRPLVTIQLDQHSFEGNSVAIHFSLSGPAAHYPVLINYSVSGTADVSDFTELSGVLTIDEGVGGTLSLRVLQDESSEGDETIVITLQESDAAALGTRIVHTLTITEENLPPHAEISMAQDGEQRSVFYRSGGVASLTALANDRNPDDSLSYDWSESSSDLGLSPTDEAVATFDPALVATGHYRVRLTVSDDAVIPAMVSRARLVRVEESEPTLSTTADSDGDGRTDTDEGAMDSDGDGIEDYLDTNSDVTILPLTTGDDSPAVVTDAGLRLKLGDVSRVSDKRGAAVSDDDLLQLLDETQTPLENTIDKRYRHPLGLFDFEVDQLPTVGQTIRVVLPLPDRIPEDAVYRKYSETRGWQDFVVDDENKVESGSEAQDICPQIADPAYTAGLTSGHYCVQLTISDGGPNDSDERANGVVRDPGGVAVFVPDVTPPDLTIPADITVEAVDGNGVPQSSDAIQTYLNEPSCQDSLDGELSVASEASDDVDLSEGSTSIPLGTITVTFTCVDESSNLAEGAGTISVVDTTAPELDLPAALSIESDGAVQSNDSRIVEFLSAASCTDAVSIDPQITHDAPASFPEGSTSVTFTCTDEARNETAATVSITISQPTIVASDNSGGAGAGCFIATAAYGSHLDPHVTLLRRFRDRYLLSNEPGRIAVRFYYRHSPPITETISRNEALRSLTRWMLTPIVYSIVYPVHVLVACIMLLALVLAAKRKRSHRLG